MSTISTKQIKEEQKQIMILSEKNDDVHFTLHINQDCQISQLGFSKDTQFNSVLILIDCIFPFAKVFSTVLIMISTELN